MKTALSPVANKYIRSIPAALKALAQLSREISSARTFDQLRKLEDAAKAIQLIYRDIDAVKQSAEDVVLDAHVRIGEELNSNPQSFWTAGKN